MDCYFRRDNVPAHQPAVSILRAESGLATYFLSVLSAKQKQHDKMLSTAGIESSHMDLAFKHLTVIGRTLVEHCLVNPEADQELIGPGCECLLKNINLIASNYPGKIDEFFVEIGKINMIFCGWKIISIFHI